MANPTTYFGWVMPTSSSLVTNLPADFNTFGQGVDTSLQDLLGGTTGQVLSKTSGTNMDFTWVTPTDQTPLTTKGDLFAFSTVDARLPAGANETRLVADSAQTLGLKYVADTTNYAIAAKADLLVGTAADTLAALTVGTNGQVLTADSTVSPTGLKWATPAASSSGVTLVTSGTFTSVTSFSVNSAFSATYKNYMVIINMVADTSVSTVKFRYRVSGTDNTTSNYYGGQFGYSSAAALSSNFANPDTSVPLKSIYPLASWGMTANQFTFYDPFNNATSGSNAHPFTFDSFDPNSINGRIVGGGQCFQNAAFDGFSLLFDNASTGTYRIYGWG
jgi:hypothetical protein